MRKLLMLVALSGFAVGARADDVADIKALLGREIIGPRQARLDVTEFVRARIPTVKTPTTAAEWTRDSESLRQKVLDEVVFRGEAKKWRDFKVNVKWLDQTIPGGTGYRIKKLRYEALPGLWIPALLYEPEKLTGKVPVMLAVNGHDGAGKAAPYKQERCINLAKRGMIALNIEWVGMGQLRGAGYRHGCMNQLDLCGTSGLAVFYLNMQRGLDVLLQHEHADPKRVGVSGLSGGGWQTIMLSALDTRVTLTNPVAGYSSFFTRLDHHKDLGDSEQTPCDLATVADYTHLTAMLAPRAALLTYNSKDNCCFESGYVLPVLEKAARPIYRLYGKETSLRTHVNNDPGDHNYGQDNREALYRQIGAHWFAESKDFSAKEIDVRGEIKKADELFVELPKENADFNSLAKALMKDLPRPLPTERQAALAFQAAQKKKLAEVLRMGTPYVIKAELVTEEKKGNISARSWKVFLGNDDNVKTWTVPVVELEPETIKGTTVLVGDAGRRGLAADAGHLLKQGQRVCVVDPFYNGEASVDTKAYLFALMTATVGHRPLGVQVMQLQGIQRWLAERHKLSGAALHAVGPRACVTGLAAAQNFEHFTNLTLENPIGSLKLVIEENRSFDQSPELFCFGLLGEADVKTLAALVAPRPVRVLNPSEHVKSELASLKKWYGLLGQEFDPLATK